MRNLNKINVWFMQIYVRMTPIEKTKGEKSCYPCYPPRGTPVFIGIWVVAPSEKIVLPSCYTLLPKTVNNFNLSASYKRNEHWTLKILKQRMTRIKRIKDMNITTERTEYTDKGIITDG